MLELRDVTLRLKREDRVLAEAFSFTLKKGDKAVLIGEEGNGKSTLLKYIYDPASIEDYCEGCGNCVKRCPQKALRLEGGRSVCDHGKCVLCGYCAKVCPLFAVKVL